jgi:hypothetical protein
VNKKTVVWFIVCMLILAGCSSATTALPIITPPPATDTPIPTSTSTPQPPTETLTPTPTEAEGIWLDPREFEITVHHPASTAQPGWGTPGEIVIPVEGYVGGVVFTVVEINGSWSPAISASVDPKNSVFRQGSSRALPLGTYCVADYFPGFNPDSACDAVSPDSIHQGWITSYFAGYKNEVGIAFGAGGCDPKTCTVDLKVSGIRLIMYEPPES